MIAEDVIHSGTRILSRTADLPVSIEHARAFLKAEGFNEDDDVIRSLIAGAANNIERKLNICLLPTIVEDSFNRFPPSHLALWLTYGPLVQLQEIKYYSASTEDWEVWDHTGVIPLNVNYKTGIMPPINGNWPSDYLTREGLVVVKYQCYLAEKPCDLPQDLTLAILLQAAHLYEFRENPSEIYPGAQQRVSEMLLRPYANFNF